MAAPEIGLNHSAVRQDRGRRTFRNLAAVMHGDGTIGESAEEPNIVIDDAERRTVLAEVAQHLTEIGDLAVTKTSSRLVEQQQFGLAHQRHGDTEHFFIAIRETQSWLITRLTQPTKA